MPVKGQAPKTEGVAGMLVSDAPPPTVMFGLRKMKKSPYDPLLIELKNAGAGKYLRFESVRARAAIALRAKKLNISIVFGEDGSTLWVMLSSQPGNANVTDNKTVNDNDDDGTREATIRNTIINFIRNTRFRRASAGEILTHLRSRALGISSITYVDNILRELAKQKKIKLGLPGADDTERWVVA